MKQYVGIVRDHSGSMRRLASKAKDDYNTQIAAIKAASLSHTIDTIVSTLKCGVDRRLDGRIGVTNEWEFVNSNVSVLNPITVYDANGSGTPLFDAIGEMIDTLNKVPDASAAGVSFLIMVITDGHENYSTKWSATTLRNKINELQNSDRWTFTFRVPVGYKRDLVRLLGVFDDNVIEWEQTNAGFNYATEQASAALSSYYGMRASGGTATRSFFKPSVASLNNNAVQGSLTDVSTAFNRAVVTGIGSNVIRDFCFTAFGRFEVGKVFYQLTKPEKEVQDYKRLVIRDRVTDKLYAGPAARQLLQLPLAGTIKLVPADYSQYDIFIQSNSTNRKLVTGTTVLYDNR